MLTIYVDMSGESFVRKSLKELRIEYKSAICLFLYTCLSIFYLFYCQFRDIIFQPRKGEK